MMTKYFLAYTALFLLFISSFPAHADTSCVVTDKTCVMATLQKTAAEIGNENWRDQTYRELAKTLASHGKTDQAIMLIPKIKNPDTQAMTIRGIGMAAADLGWTQDAYDELFSKLEKAKNTITHEASYAIAETYIAMSQAFANDDQGAWNTAAAMENDALKHKAYGETAEIQAEKGKFTEAMKSIGYIDSEAFRNKAYTTVSNILADHKHMQEAYDAAIKITNPYKQATALQYLLDKQDEFEREEKEMTSGQ